MPLVSNLHKLFCSSGPCAKYADTIFFPETKLGKIQQNRIYLVMDAENKFARSGIAIIYIGVYNIHISMFYSILFYTNNKSVLSI